MADWRYLLDDFECGTFSAPVVLVSITVTLANITLPVGGTQQYVAIGLYSDSSTADITSSVVWASSIITIATITLGGLAIAVASSSTGTVISATLGAISGSTNLYVIGLLRNPRLRFFDVNHKPLVGGKLYLCTTGASSIVNTQASYHNYSKTILNPNPIILDSAGYACPIFGDTLYKVFLYDTNDNFVLAQDNVWSTVRGVLQLAMAQLQFWDVNGSPLVNGKLYTCQPGSGTINNLKDSYSNAVLSTLNDNPIILNINGLASLIYTLTDFYKLFIFDANDVLMFSQDNVGPS